MAIFDSKTLQECTESLARYHPNGDLFLAKNVPGTNYNKFLRGLSTEICRAQDLLITYIEEILPDQTTLLIEEWESAVGIPDSCFSAEESTSDRRRDILLKLAASGLQTAQDFVDFGKLFGFVDPDPGVVVVTQGVSKFEIIITFPFSDAEEFPLEFPIFFGSTTQGILECMYTKLKPANCSITFMVA